MALQRISDLAAGTPPYSSASLLEVSVPTGASPPYASRRAALSDIVSDRVAKSGDTMSGTLALPNLSVAGTGSIALGGVAFARNEEGYHKIFDATGTVTMWLGATADHVNYHEQTEHHWASRGSAAQYASITSAGLTILGQGYKPGGGVWADITSDARTKDAVANYTRGLEAVLQLLPVSFRHNGKAGTVADNRMFVGLIADEAKNVMPEMIGVRAAKLDPDDADTTDILTLDATPLIYALVNSCKELAARIEALESRLPA